MGIAGERKILFTGGGSSGHVTPNLALIPKFQQANWSVIYIGSKTGIEQQLIKPLKIPYFSIPTGKLRRYFSWQTFIDPFKILAGIIKAFFICLKEKPDIVFSKGGFVAVPVVIAAWLNRIPVVIHEADLTPGLANKLSTPFAKKICVSFRESQKHYDKNKTVITGLPIRQELLRGDANKGRDSCRFNLAKPIILVTGGGLGAEKINEIIRQCLPVLLQKYQVVHLCGAGKTDDNLGNLNGYQQFDYVTDAYADLLACADLIISRSGANSLYEILTLKKPHILIPLPLSASRGDQIQNANYFKQQGISEVITQEQLTPELLQAKIDNVLSEQAGMQQNLNQLNLPDAITMTYQTIIDAL